MSRPTDTERGARMARDAAVDALHPDLFGGLSGELNDMYWSIFAAANDQLAECQALREAVHGR